jgi:hypothetical protein
MAKPKNPFSVPILVSLNIISSLGNLCSDVIETGAGAGCIKIPKSVNN